ncbi:MAG: hypothetical protein ABIP49_02995 [Lysobacterales bacterium]
MPRIHIIRCVLPLAAAVASFGAMAETAETLVAKNYAARGGLERIEAIKSVEVEGEMVFNGTFKLALKQISKGGNAMRSEATAQGLTSVQAFDGKEGWAISPFQGRRDPERMSADDAKSMRESADFNGSLVGYREAGKRLEYLGVENIDGTMAHKLRLTDKAGDQEVIYLDPDYFLEIRTVTRRTVRGNEQEVETDIGDYEKVDGVYFPFAFEIGDKGQDDKPQKITIDKMVANVEVDDARFAFPESAAKSTPATTDPAESGASGDPPSPPAEGAQDPAEMENPGMQKSDPSGAQS